MNIETEWAGKIQATAEQRRDAKARMKQHWEADPETFMNAFHDYLEADAANRAYVDAFNMFTAWRAAESKA